MDDDVRTRARNAVLGALVGDAAAMGLHWIYDVERIRELGGDTPEFHAATDYHQGREPGQLTHYGDHLRVALESLVASGGLDTGDYVRRMEERFGAGYDGYVDHATKDLLASGKGADDNQAGCFTKLPVLVVRYLDAPDDEFDARIEEGVRATHDNAQAVRASTAAARAIRAAIRGAAPADAVQQAAGVSGAVDHQVGTALEAGDDVIAFAKEHGQSCPVPSALPVALHAALHGDTFEDVVRSSILSGGDTSGRLLVTAAIRGATDGVPDAWLARLVDREQVESLVDRLLDASPVD